MASDEQLRRENQQLRGELAKAHKLNNLIAPLEARVDELTEGRYKFASVVAGKEWALQAALNRLKELEARIVKLEAEQR